MPELIDTDVYLSRWPFRRLPADEPAALVEKLRASGVTQAWAGSFDALLHRDIAGVNERLAESCAHHKMLLPFGTVNPTLPDWREDLRRCHEQFKMPGIRLHPNYHGYHLANPEFIRLLTEATERRLLVQLAVQMEDERTQHPLLRVAPVDVTSLPAIAKKIPKLRLQLLNNARLPTAFTDTSIYVDFAMVEGVHGLSNLLRQTKRVLFGSYYPFFVFESAIGKIKEAAIEDSSIFAANAKALLEAK